MKVSIVIPAYNEGPHIRKVLAKVPKEYEAIVVDDGSTDHTAKEAREAGAKVIPHGKNKGKGQAVLTGLREAKGDIVVLMDADDQHNPSEIRHLIKPIIDGEADLVIGSRFQTGFRHTPRFRQLTNSLSNMGTSVASNNTFTDVLCGFRAVRRDSLTLLELKPARFEIEVDMLIDASRKGLKIKEIPVSLLYGEETSHISFRDGVRLSTHIFAEAWRSLFRRKMNLKQVIVVRKDLELSKGKLAVQVAHASLGAYERANLTRKQYVEDWKLEGQKKVVLSVDTLSELKELHKKAMALKLPTCLIQDAGLTEIEPGTVTALGIGPAPEAEIDKITGSLSTLK
jgi:peptidyl-tRNA hydrolase